MKVYIWYVFDYEAVFVVAKTLEDARKRALPECENESQKQYVLNKDPDDIKACPGAWHDYYA